LEDRGGEIFGITAQSFGKVEQVKASWNLSFPIISDEAHILADMMRSQGHVDIALAARSDFKFGVMTQPAVVIFNAQHQVLYSWAVVPSLSNVNGGCDRPVFKDVWATVLDKLDGRQVVRKISRHGFFSAASF
jgi:peroxiredoxin